VPVTERPSTRYPLSLLTGRGSSAQWHTGTRTSKSAVLVKLAPQAAYVEIAPADALAIGVEASEWVVVESARGSMRARALVTPTVPEGHVFVPMHDAATNRLTFPAFDPHSRQPSYKTGAVAVRPLHPWER
jgi:assimilatory nitrate reductase catalytic subunit